VSDLYADPVVHDPAVPPGPRVRLRLVLALLRIASGRRGWASVRWSGQGFVYTVKVMRALPKAYTLDADPDAIGLNEVAERLGALIEDDND
jgi:hypothetical protein